MDIFHYFENIEFFSGKVWIFKVFFENNLWKKQKVLQTDVWVEFRARLWVADTKFSDEIRCLLFWIVLQCKAICQDSKVWVPARFFFQELSRIENDFVSRRQPPFLTCFGRTVAWAERHYLDKYFKQVFVQQPSPSN
jgi:hypothetical protein